MQAAAASGFARALISDDEGYSRPNDLSGYARALVGTEIVVSGPDGREMTGTLLDCVDRSVDRTDTGNRGHIERPGSGPALLLVDRGGALFVAPLDEVSAMRPTSRREAVALERFTAQMGRSGGYAAAEVVLTTTPDSAGRLAVSYLRQAPLWRMHYRVTPRGDAVTLEAWAVVHNDTPEDWREVGMTLVSGRPASYLMSTASPRYRKRESLLLDDDDVDLTPQLGTETPDSLLYPSELESLENFGYGGLGLIGTGRGGGGSGEGTIGLGHLDTFGVTESPSSLIALGSPAAEGQAEAAVEGELSTYTALVPMTVRAGASALVPVLRRTLPGISFVRIDGDKVPETCVRLSNGSGLVLQRGAVSVTVDGRFRGQAELPRTEPEETYVFCFGSDPDIFNEVNKEVTWEPRLLEWTKRGLFSHGVRTTSARYTIENKTGRPRRLAIHVKRAPNGRFLTEETPIPGRGERDFLFMLDIAKCGTIVRTIGMEEAIKRSEGLDVENLTGLLGHRPIAARYGEPLRAALEMARQIDSVESKVSVSKGSIDKLEDVIRRLRENLASVPELEGSAPTADAILKDIMTKEKTIADTQKMIEAYETDIAALESKQKAILERIAFPEAGADGLALKKEN